jgi:hypothetical protein
MKCCENIIVVNESFFRRLKIIIKTNSICYLLFQNNLTSMNLDMYNVSNRLLNRISSEKTRN